MLPRLQGMANSWSIDAANYLTNWARCPRCDKGALQDGWCPICNASLTGSEATELAGLSQRAAEAIRRRQVLIDNLPTVARRPASVPVPATSSTATAAASSTALPVKTGTYTATGTPFTTARTTNPAPATQARSSSQISVQSVLAVAGAGLLAIAALVFTFLNPDLTDVTLRTVIIGVTTAIFLGGAWLLARARLQFSAEAVGALGMVFVALDIWALTLVAPAGTSPWLFAGIGTLVSSALMMLVAGLARIRSWAWSGAVGITISFAFFGYAGTGNWWSVGGHVAVAFAALGLHVVVPSLEKRMGAPLRAELVTATVIQLLAVGIVLLQVLVLTAGGGDPIAAVLVLAVLAALAALSARTILPRLWSYATGAFAVAAIAVAPFALRIDDSTWLVALVPAGAALALAAAAAAPTRIRGLSRAFSLGGAWTVALAAAVPSIALGVAQLFAPVVQLANAAEYNDGYSYEELQPSSPAPDLAVGNLALVSPSAGLAAILGLVALTLGSLALWRLARLPQASIAPQGAGTPVPRMVVVRQPLGLGRSALLLAAWSGAGAVLTLAGWSAIVRPAQATVGLVLAVVISAALLRVPLFRKASLGLRLPAILAAHGLVFLVGLISWADESITVVVGAAMVVAFVAVAQTVPLALRPLHFGVGYAYGLIVFATALTYAGVGDIAVLCLTTSLASVFALGVTLTGWLRPATWYAILIVTIVPFLCAVAAVLLERSGWTALSTALTFGLALAVLITKRSGLTSFLRIAAAALLVPSLAVVVVCLGAQFLVISGSLVTLPVIAVIIAAVLPSTGLIRTALLNRGLTSADALAARNWIEYSSFATAVLAVVLAVARPAAGFGTSFIVLFILGLGSLATAFFSHRRYAWWTAAASFTGALWSVWAIVGVDLLEPYLLPPALSAVIVGAALTARGRPAVGLFTSGLASATLPTLAILTISGSGAGGIAWRSYGLLAGAVVLVALGWWLTRVSPAGRRAALRELQRPVLIVAIVSTAAAAVQAVRYGGGFDPLLLVDEQLVMLVVLAFSIGGFALSTVAARLLLQRARGRAADAATFVPSRWLFAAPLLYLTLGTIPGIRPGVLPIATLWVLMAVLLAVMVVAVLRARTRQVALPPTWFLFALAWCAAVAGWSERDLRVEFFSLPLGLALLAAGIVAQRSKAALVVGKPGWTSWPLGFTGSWRTLTPGILVVFVTSVLSTGTDPQTWRAILVIALALVAIFIGSVRKLAAPFIIGIIVLPVENLVVFLVQIGTIGAGAWWITLSTAGAVLLVLAVTSERSTTGDRGVASRLRDLT